MPQHRTTRRGFLGATGRMAAGGAATLGLPAFISPRAFARDNSAAPSDRVRLGFIGVRNQGTNNLKSFFRQNELADVVAVCDVDSAVLSAAQALVEKQTGRSCAAHRDYRELLDDQNIDAVVITTPDHWHALQTIDACAAGKDVYCEKPLTLTIAEGQAMVEAARQHQRIVQTGSQQRSDDRFRLACELVRSGRIGKVHTVRAGIADVNFKGPAVPDAEPPAELDYNSWLGPAPERPYNVNRVHYNFRFFWDYSGGQLTNWGAHNLDIAQWGLGRDGNGPVSVEGEARFHKDGWYEAPEWCRLTYEYDDGVRLLCGHDERGGTTFEGEDGAIFVDRRTIEATPNEILREPLTDSDVRLEVSKNHQRNWLDCIRSRELPICDVAIGHRSATVCHLGNIALRSGRRVVWDPAKEQIVGDSELAQMASRPYRAPWRLTPSAAGASS